MNIKTKEIEKFITTAVENYCFYRKMKQDEEPVKEILEWCKENPDIWPNLKTILNGKFYPKYSLSHIERTGNTVTRVALFESNYHGALYGVKFKGLEFSFECLQDGEINRPYLIYSAFQSSTGWINLSIAENFADYYKQALAIIAEDKREIMTYYNKQIKELKTDYRERLSAVNALLKWEDSPV